MEEEIEGRDERDTEFGTRSGRAVRGGDAAAVCFLFANGVFMRNGSGVFFS